MKSWIRPLAVLCACACALGATTGLGAQERATTLQAEAKRRFQEMHERMQKLQVIKQQTEPEEGRVLAAGNRFIQERQLGDAMDEVGALIADGRYDEALDRIDGVQQDLQRLLDLLLDRDVDLEKLLAEIERLERYHERVEELLTDQRAEKDAAAESERLERHLQELEAAREAARELLEAQEELRDQADQAGLSAPEEKAREMSEREGGLKERTENLADKLERIEKDGDKLGTSKPKDGEPPSESKPGSCSGSCKGAAGAMGKAQSKLQKNQPENALKDMDEAARKLEQTVKQLDQMSEEARRKLLELPFDQQAHAQEQTRIDTDHLAQDMESDDREASEKGEGPQQTPGKKNVQQAVPKQKAAAGQLKDYKPGKAKQDQQDAADELQKAKQQLEDALSQLRQQLQDEVLRALEARFGAMLERQKELSARTKAAHRLARNAITASGAAPAQVVERAAQIAVGEHQLSGEAGDSLKLLEEEGTSAAFPAVVALLRDDLTRVAGRLDKTRTGKTTQIIQADIEQTLKDLIDALRRQIEMNAGQGGSCQCDGQPVLVPLSAELRLVMIKQKHVNRRTAEFDEGFDADLPGEAETDDILEQVGELARQQGVVEDLLRRMAAKMGKDAQGNR